MIANTFERGVTAFTFMGNTYPGAGSTIGPAMTFGDVAALDAADELG